MEDLSGPVTESASGQGCSTSTGELEFRASEIVFMLTYRLWAGGGRDLFLVRRECVARNT